MQLQAARPGDEKGDGLEPGRADMVRTAALTYGAQGGLAGRSFALNEMLRRHQAELDSAYDFRVLVLPVGAGQTMMRPKRFLNAMILRQRMAEARGFGDEVRLPTLAKLMLAERFLPRLFDQIAAAAAAAPDGKCPDLHAFERASHEDAPTPKPRRGAKPATDVKGADGEAMAPPLLHPVGKPDSAVLGEWMSTPAIKAWAVVQPAIGEEDLRPYLFVAKDRKDYFGAASVLGHLAAVAEQLFGVKFAVQASEPELRRLAPAEAAQVFEVVRGRILAEANFETEPAGIAGLTVLVKAQPTLQGSLIDFLEGLPRAQVGPWACGGWEAVLKDPEASQRFDRLLQLWSKEGSGMTKVTAAGALRTRMSHR